MGSLISTSQQNTFPRAPRLIYGTAWKRDQTASLTYEALSKGFRSVDTAADLEHYKEELTGAGIRKAVSEGIVRRCDVYVSHFVVQPPLAEETRFISVQIQTKYSPVPLLEQDLSSSSHRVSSAIETSVNESIQSSLDYLSIRQTSLFVEDDWIDCLLLHCHMPSLEETLQVWRAMEAHVPKHVRALGISNISTGNLALLFEAVTIKPAVVQNPFQPATGFDRELRSFCKRHDIEYQAFFVLKKNKKLMESRIVEAEARRLGVSREGMLMYLVARLVDGAVLNGTCSTSHMEQDVTEFEKIRQWYSSPQGVASFDVVQSTFEKLLSNYEA